MERAAATVTPKRAVATQQTKRREEMIAGFTFMFPAVFILFVFMIIPLGVALFFSITDWSGQTPLGQTLTPASGAVVFTNQSADEITISAGTIVTAGEGDDLKEYRVLAPVTLAAGAGSTVEAPIEAVTAGEDGNSRPDAITGLPPDLIERVTVTNPARVRGGLDDAYQLVGLRNYEQVLISGRRVDDFYTALKNTMYYVLGVVPTQTLIALLLASVVNQRWLRGRGFFRTAFYFPSITSSVVISLIFVFLFSRSGPVNGLLNIIPGYESITWLDNADGVLHNFLALFGITRQSAPFLADTQFLNLSLWDWLSGPSVTMLTIMLLAIWTTIGTMMVIYLAALQGIPGQVYEAAKVDGATGWQTFRFITFPLLRPTTFFVVTIGLIGTFQVFDQVYVISKGEPEDTTLTIAYLVYRNAFGSDPAMGRAAATAIVLFIIIFVFTLLQRRLTGGDRAEA